MGSKVAPSHDLLERTRWYIKLRWYILAGITLPTLLSLYIGHRRTSVQIAGAIITIGLFLVNGIFFGLSHLKRGRTYFRVLELAMLAFDSVFISFFVFLRGGIESRVVILYSIPIIMSALFFGRAGVYTTAICSAVLYDFVIAGNYFKWFHNHNMVTNEGSQGGYVLYTIVFFTLILLAIAVLTDFLTRLLIQKEREATDTSMALRRAQAIAKLGSWEWDIKTNTIAISDELFKMVKRYTRNITDFHGLMRFIHPEDQAWVKEIMAKAVKDGKPYSYDNRILLPDKTVRVMHVEGKPLLNKKGKVVKVYGTAQDITDDRSLEIAKGDFVALASHQLRTPASGVRMLLAMLRDGYVGTLTPEQLQAVEEAFVANEHLLRISDDLLNVAKLESGRLTLNKQQIELCRWLKTVAAPHKLLAKERGQRLRIEIPKGTVFMHGDADRLAMVIDNVLSNARKYTPVRGQIGIRLQPGRSVHKIIVTDNGNGMNKAELSKLFSKFTRIDNPGSRGVEGTGLGLYLAKSIVDLHGGRIQVRSKPDQGSTFTITLPVAH